jgi:hypothetical protein
MAQPDDDVKGAGYKVGPGRPPLHTHFKKGQSGNPRGARVKQLSDLLREALNQQTVVTIDGRRRRMTKREAMVAQLVEKSAAADLRAARLVLDLQKQAEAMAARRAKEAAAADLRAARLLIGLERRAEAKAAAARPAPEAELDAADAAQLEAALARLGMAE